MIESQSTKFERQIERIHQLLEGEDAHVTWDDRIPDPDNPEQPRQIDVTIRRGETLTMVECRIHKAKQDVNWIEELVGRRQSLRADAVIAVSASGFTEGAKKKAAAYGVILRNLSDLSEEEIRNWGKITKVSITYYHFENCVITFILPYSVKTPISITTESGIPMEMRELFQVLMNTLDSYKKLDHNFGTVDAKFEVKLLVSGVKPESTSMSCRVRRMTAEIELASVVVYAATESSSEAEAHVQKFDFGSFEIIQHIDDVAAIVDLSSVKAPRNHFFYTVNFDFGRNIKLKKCLFIGEREALNYEAFVEIRLKLARGSAV